MLWQILKKDMMKRKGVNIILFLFITLSTIFLASSFNNIMIVGSAVDYYMEYAHVPDVNVIINSEKEKDKIDQWLEQQKEKGEIVDFDYNHFLEISQQSITINRNGKNTNLENNGVSLYLTTMDVDYCQVFDKNGNVPELKEGEVALSLTMMELANLYPGDKVTIKSNELNKEFVIKEAVKDAAFGSDMMGMSRFILNENDFNDYKETTSKLGVYYITATDTTHITKELNNQGFNGVMNTITIDTYKMVYSFDMIVAGLLIVIGICLILIALLVLRFTLVFSIEEQYQEIGILKAIGLRNLAIKKLYLIKYLAIVLTGTVLGTIISIPVSQMMIKSVSMNMIMQSAELNIGINMLCALFIIVLVLSFCYLCTRKLNKISAITAIRGGYTGERFHQSYGVKLTHFSKIPVSSYLGMNDIMTHLTRYIVLIITFCLSFILITIPLNTLNTMRSTEMMKKFAIDPDSSVYLKKIETVKGVRYHSVTDLTAGMDQVEKELEDKGYQVEMTGEPIYFINYSDQSTKQNNNLMTIQLVGKERNFFDYDQGQDPKLENEIAFSKAVMDENGWVIGDSVIAKINGENQRLIITGVYSDYMQLGKSARLNSKVNCELEAMFDYWTVMVDLDTKQSQDEIVKTLQKDFPDYEWKTGQEVIDDTVGGIQDTLDSMLIPMTALLCAVIMLITLLMEKLFIVREKGEIAMLKSIGFRYKAIRNWQLMRMLLVVFVSMIISIPISLLSNHFILKPIFAIMGADVKIQVNPLQAYLIYPGILLIGIVIATIAATQNIRKINIREMNNLE